MQPHPPACPGGVCLGLPDMALLLTWRDGFIRSTLPLPAAHPPPLRVGIRRRARCLHRPDRGPQATGQPTQDFPWRMATATPNGFARSDRGHVCPSRRAGIRVALGSPHEGLEGLCPAAQRRGEPGQADGVLAPAGSMADPVYSGVASQGRCLAAWSKKLNSSFFWIGLGCRSSQVNLQPNRLAQS